MSSRACNKKMKVKLSELKQNEIQNPILPNGFIKRVIDYKAILGDIENSTIEEAVNNFQRDKEPEKELQIWEKITNLYQSFIAENKITDFTQKKDIFRTILGKSMGL